MAQRVAGQTAAGPDRRRSVLTRLLIVAGVGGLVVLLSFALQGGGPSIEALAVLALLVGALLILGPQPDRPWQLAGTDRAVAAGTTAAIDALDRVEHRRIELGTPWPQMVVGPAGVSIVDICSDPGPIHLSIEGLHRGDRRCARCEAANDAAVAARRLLEGIDGGPGVPVRVLVVVPPATRVTRAPGLDGRIDAVPADRLSDRLARGPVLPMAVVDRAFTRLASLSGTQATNA